MAHAPPPSGAPPVSPPGASPAVPDDEANLPMPEGYVPYVQAQTSKSPFAIPLTPLGFAAPLRWLAAGWGDFLRAPVIGLFYGACFTAMGWALMTVYQHAPAYVLALSAGFLLVGPLMCLGLYHVSRQLGQGRKPDFGESLMAWDRKLSTLGIFGFVLLVLEMLWGRASLIVFAVSFDGMPDFKGSLTALLNPDNLQFIVAYLLVGGFFAGLIFAISVVAMPMILDRRTDAITAGLTSFRLVLTQPLVMLWWGALITVIIVAAMLPGFAGLLVAGPVVGHATWHAYREAVGWPEGESPDLSVGPAALDVPG